MRRGGLALHALWSRLEANRKNTRFGKELEARRRRWPPSTPLSPAARLFASLADRPNPLSNHERSATI